MRGMVVGSGFFKYRKAALYENDDQKKFKTMTVKYVGIAGLKKRAGCFWKKIWHVHRSFCEKSLSRWIRRMQWFHWLAWAGWGLPTRYRQGLQMTFTNTSKTKTKSFATIILPSTPAFAHPFITSTSPNGAPFKWKRRPSLSTLSKKRFVTCFEMIFNSKQKSQGKTIWGKTIKKAR